MRIKGLAKLLTLLLVLLLIVRSARRGDLTGSLRRGEEEVRKTLARGGNLLND